jgi:proteasome lid subunit RPN8/RPN11
LIGDEDAPFLLPEAMREEIVAHARAEAPRECCGVIGGRAGHATRLDRLTNLEPGVDRYRIDDAELYRVYRELDDAGADIVAIYHSHPVSAAYPSRTDVALAMWPDAVYLICSLADPTAPDLRAFRIRDGQITETPLTTKD